MLRFAILFAVLALIAGVLGFGGLAGDFAYFAKILLFVFLVLFVLSLLFGKAQREKPVARADKKQDLQPETSGSC
jgi:uncharacterized membrane protein YtjA (UPF0391 family)